MKRQISLDDFSRRYATIALTNLPDDYESRKRIITSAITRAVTEAISNSGHDEAIGLLREIVDEASVCRATAKEVSVRTLSKAEELLHKIEPSVLSL